MENADYLRCIICMGWFHAKCCDSEDELQYETVMFTCPTCRPFSQVLLLVQKQVEAITVRLDALSLIPNNAGSDDSHVSCDAITSSNSDAADETQMSSDEGDVADEINMSSDESDENTDSEDNAIEVSDAETQDISILISG